MMFKGAITALVTPFKDGEIDEEAYRNLIEWQIEQGINGLVPVGTTGESATLSHEEHRRVVKICVETVKKRVPVIAGAGSNSTREALELVEFAKSVGADAALLVTPYYNKPTQEGLYQHYKTIAEETGFPLVLYNVPGRTSVNLLPQTVARLAEIENIVAIKEASGSLKQISEIISLCGDKITVISGDDFTVLPTLAVGGMGVISVVSNVAPQDMAALCQAFFDKDREKAQDLHYRLFPLAQAMFLETNPIPVKTALGLMGKIKPELRLPLAPMSE
ncbi:MAG: 4-hydroxy-tetrahydrodipicolinate synthase, partial [Candidatus Desulfofervidaceae bacterium]|nr:4-hydroxy-tetrahydrodipicolinate synthase [Candidatus Desulfofervidaceae bacterium]